MPISSTLAARLRTGHSPAPAPARRSPYARPSVPETSGGAKASRPPLRLDPATTRLLGASQKAVRSGLGRRADPDAPDARAPVPKRKLAAGDDRPPLEGKRRCRGEGGFVFLRALAGHTEAISGISLPLGSDKLYSGSVDGSVRIWDCNSGKVVWFSAPANVSDHAPATYNVSDYARATNNLSELCTGCQQSLWLCTGNGLLPRRFQ